MKIVRCAGFVVVAVVLAACGKQQSADPPAGTGAGATMATMESAGSPTMEGGGPEPPRTGDGGVAVSLPRLPVGGGTDDSSLEHQCAVASWAGNDIPEGMSIEVTGVDFDPRGVFAVDGSNGSSCDGRPACARPFAFTSARESCSVPVRAVVSGSGEARLVLVGSCGRGDSGECRDILASSSPSTVPLSYEPPEESSSESSSEEQPPDTTETSATG